MLRAPEGQPEPDFSEDDGSDGSVGFEDEDEAEGLRERANLSEALGLPQTAVAHLLKLHGEALVEKLSDDRERERVLREAGLTHLLPAEETPIGGAAALAASASSEAAAAAPPLMVQPSGRRVALQLKDDDAFETELEPLMAECKTIEDMLEEAPTDPPRLPLVSADEMRFVVRFCRMRHDQRRSRATPVPQDAFTQQVQALDQGALSAHLRSANFLGADGLLRELSLELSRRLRGKTSDEVRAEWGLPEDMPAVVSRASQREPIFLPARGATGEEEEEGEEAAQGAVVGGTEGISEQHDLLWLSLAHLELPTLRVLKGVNYAMRAAVREVLCSVQWQAANVPLLMLACGGSTSERIAWGGQLEAIRRRRTTDPTESFASRVGFGCTFSTSALDHAVRRRDLPMCEVLLEDLERLPQERAALLHSLDRAILESGEEGHAPTFRMLLTAYVGHDGDRTRLLDMLRKVCGSMVRADDAASLRERIEMLAELVDVHGAPVEMGNSGTQPLHLAAKQGRLPIVKALLERGANPTLRDGKPTTSWRFRNTPRQLTSDEAVANCLREAERNWS